MQYSSMKSDEQFSDSGIFYVFEACYSTYTVHQIIDLINWPFARMGFCDLHANMDFVHRQVITYARAVVIR